MEVALALIAASPPLTAAILRFRRVNGGEGKYVTVREFDAHRADLGDTLVEIRASMRELEQLIKSHLK